MATIRQIKLYNAAELPAEPKKHSLYIIEDNENLSIHYSDEAGNVTQLTGAVRSITKTITNAQIIALRTTPVEIIPAPGAGKILEYLSSVLIVASDEAAYGNVDEAANFQFIYEGGISASIPSTVGSDTLTDQEYNWLRLGAEDSGTTYATVSQVENLPIQLKMVGQPVPLTGGHADNHIDVTVYYAVLDV